MNKNTYRTLLDETRLQENPEEEDSISAFPPISDKNRRIVLALVNAGYDASIEHPFDYPRLLIIFPKRAYKEDNEFLDMESDKVLEVLLNAGFTIHGEPFYEEYDFDSTDTNIDWRKDTIMCIPFLWKDAVDITDAPKQELKESDEESISEFPVPTFNIYRIGYIDTWGQRKLCYIRAQTEQEARESVCKYSNMKYVNEIEQWTSSLDPKYIREADEDSIAEFPVPIDKTQRIELALVKAGFNTFIIEKDRDGHAVPPRVLIIFPNIKYADKKNANRFLDIENEKVLKSLLNAGFVLDTRSLYAENSFYRSLQFVSESNTITPVLWMYVDGILGISAQQELKENNDMTYKDILQQTRQYENAESENEDSISDFSKPAERAKIGQQIRIDIPVSEQKDHYHDMCYTQGATGTITSIDMSSEKPFYFRRDHGIMGSPGQWVSDAWIVPLQKTYNESADDIAQELSQITGVPQTAPQEASIPPPPEERQENKEPIELPMPATPQAPSQKGPEEAQIESLFTQYYPTLGTAGAVQQISQDLNIPYAAAHAFVTNYLSQFTESDESSMSDFPTPHQQTRKQINDILRGRGLIVYQQSKRAKDYKVVYAPSNLSRNPESVSREIREKWNMEIKNILTQVVQEFALDKDGIYIVDSFFFPALVFPNTMDALTETNRFTEESCPRCGYDPDADEDTIKSFKVPSIDYSVIARAFFTSKARLINAVQDVCKQFSCTAQDVMHALAVTWEEEMPKYFTGSYRPDRNYIDQIIDALKQKKMLPAGFSLNETYHGLLQKARLHENAEENEESMEDFPPTNDLIIYEQFVEYLKSKYPDAFTAGSYTIHKKEPEPNDNILYMEVSFDPPVGDNYGRIDLIQNLNHPTLFFMSGSKYNPFNKVFLSSNVITHLQYFPEDRKLQDIGPSLPFKEGIEDEDSVDSFPPPKNDAVRIQFLDYLKNKYPNAFSFGNYTIEESETKTSVDLNYIIVNFSDPAGGRYDTIALVNAWDQPDSFYVMASIHAATRQPYRQRITTLKYEPKTRKLQDIGGGDPYPFQEDTESSEGEISNFTSPSVNTYFLTACVNIPTAPGEADNTQVLKATITAKHPEDAIRLAIFHLYVDAETGENYFQEILDGLNVKDIDPSTLLGILEDYDDSTGILSFVDSSGQQIYDTEGVDIPTDLPIIEETWDWGEDAFKLFEDIETDDLSNFQRPSAIHLVDEFGDTMEIVKDLNNMYTCQFEEQEYVLVRRTDGWYVWANEDEYGIKIGRGTPFMLYTDIPTAIASMSSAGGKVEKRNISSSLYEEVDEFPKPLYNPDIAEKTYHDVLYEIRHYENAEDNNEEESTQNFPEPARHTYTIRYAGSYHTTRFPVPWIKEVQFVAHSPMDLWVRVSCILGTTQPELITKEELEEALELFRSSEAGTRGTDEDLKEWAVRLSPNLVIFLKDEAGNIIYADTVEPESASEALLEGNKTQKVLFGDEDSLSNFPKPAGHKYRIKFKPTDPAFRGRLITITAPNDEIAIELAGVIATIASQNERPTQEMCSEFKKDVINWGGEYEKVNVSNYLFDMSIDLGFTLEVYDETIGKRILRVSE